MFIMTHPCKYFKIVLKSHSVKRIFIELIEADGFPQLSKHFHLTRIISSQQFYVKSFMSHKHITVSGPSFEIHVPTSLKIRVSKV